MAVDLIARAMASKNGGGGGSTVDAYTKEQTDILLYNKADKSNVYTKENVDDMFTETNGNVQTNANEISGLKTNKANKSEVYTKTESDSRFLNGEGTAKKAVSDENGANISESFTNVNSQISVNRTTLGTQCKNLLKNTAVSTSYSDVKFTVNSDGTVDVSSTATSTATRFLVLGTFTLNPGSYVLTGADSLGNYGDIRVYIDDVVYKHNEPFTLNETKMVIVRICIYANKTLPSEVRVYPMVRYIDIKDDTYEQYQPNLQEQITALVERITALENK